MKSRESGGNLGLHAFIIARLILGTVFPWLDYINDFIARSKSFTRIRTTPPIRLPASCLRLSQLRTVLSVTPTSLATSLTVRYTLSGSVGPSVGAWLFALRIMVTMLALMLRTGTGPRQEPNKSLKQPSG